MNKTIISLILIVLAGCSSVSTEIENDVINNSRSGDMVVSESKIINESDSLLYQGKASIRIVTRENKVIYIDPFMGDGYDLPADLILITHEHFDHNNLDKIKAKNDDCRIIRSKDAVVNGEHKVFDLGYAKVEAVEAGYNSYHNVNECVGYIITLSSGISIYVTGDTSITKQMPELAEKNIDYAFFCCDGIYNMGLDEAIEAAKMVKAKHSIPYHMTGSSTDDFDKVKADNFSVDGKLILETGADITLEKVSKAQNKTNIAVEGKNIKATLDDSETTRDFLKLLPLTIKMTGFYGREYAAGLNANISVNGEVIDDYSNGDVTYYIAGNALAIFYANEELSSQSGLIRMGRITSSLEDFKNLGENPEFTITLESEEKMNSVNEEEIVLNRYKEMQQAMVDKDEAVLNEIIKDGTTFTHMSGMTQTKEEYIADIISRRLDYKAYTIENPTVTIDGNKAILKARVSLTANAYGANGTWPFNVSAYFEKIDGKWFFRNMFEK